MNAQATEFPLYRSEAFAEDVIDLLADPPAIEQLAEPLPWLVNALPAAVALLGLAFAVVPPLA
jgi:hypothetical protein